MKNVKKIFKKDYKTAVWLWMGLIFLFSSFPASVSSKQSGFIVNILDPVILIDTNNMLTVLVRKSAHIFLFMVLGILLYKKYREDKLIKVKAAMYGIGAAISFAIFDELHQKFVTGRSSELRDVAIDSIASMIGIGVILLIEKYNLSRYIVKTRVLLRSMKNNHKFVRILKGLMITGLSFAYILAVSTVIRTSLLPGKYLYPTIATSALALVMLIIANVKVDLKHKIKSALIIIANIIYILSGLYVSGFGNSTLRYLESIQTGPYSLEVYSIVAETKTGVGLDTAGVSIGYIDNDSNKNKVLEETSSRTKAKPQGYSDLATVVDSLQSSSSGMSVIRKSMLSLLEQNQPTIFNELKVLTEFEVKVYTTGEAPKADITKPFIVYISGIDTYGEVNTVSRSDVNILMVVNPIDHKILLVNTPRDYYVQLHGTTGVRDKLTHAGIYGIDMSVSTIEDLYETTIDYYVRINFTSLLNLVDAVGGVNVKSDNTFKSGKYNFVTGYNQMDGKMALEFSRNRYAFEDGDRTRGKNQQKVIEALLDKLSSPKTLVRYKTILDKLEGAFQTNASRRDITAVLNQQMNNLGTWTTESISVDGTGSTNVTYSMGSLPLYVMEPNVESLDYARKQILKYSVRVGPN